MGLEFSGTYVAGRIELAKIVILFLESIAERVQLYAPSEKLDITLRTIPILFCKLIESIPPLHFTPKIKCQVDEIRPHFLQ